MTGIIEQTDIDRVHIVLNQSRRWYVLAILCGSLFISGIDLTILHNASSAINEAIHPSAAQLLWILDIYSLTVAALLVTCGTLSDKFGRKKIIISGLLVFGVSSLACALSQCPIQLISARIFLGIGAAMVMASTVSIIRVIFPEPAQRSFALGLWTASSSIGISLGPIIGGVLLDHYWWGSVFLINLPVIILAIITGIIFIPESKNPHPKLWDALSAFLSIIAVASIVYSIKAAGLSLTIDKPIAGIGIIGVVALIAFLRRQGKISQPLLDISLFKQRKFTIAVVSVIICFGCYVAALFFFVQWFHVVYHNTFLQAGIALFPMAIANAIGSIIAPKISTRWGLFQTLLVGLGIFSLAAICFALFPMIRAHYIFVLPVLALIGLGAGFIMTLGADAIMSAADPHRIGEAAAIQETSFELGSGLGIAFLCVIWSITYRYRLSKCVGCSHRGHGTEAISPVDFPDGASRQLLHIYDSTISDVVMSMGIVLLLCLIGSAIISRSKDRQRIL